MLLIRHRDLAPTALCILNGMQQKIDAVADYADRVTSAGREWKAKTSTEAKRRAFLAVRETLARMCIGSARCSYCEDSLADEIEHIQPKALFPGRTFDWRNYAFACGPCNGPKSSRYGVLIGASVEEFRRGPRDPVVPPPAGVAALIDPREEDPMTFLELDLGGETPAGIALSSTFVFRARDESAPSDQVRAAFTIDVLGLNREPIRLARQNAFGGFRARLREYVELREGNAPSARLAALRDDILFTPHLTVFAEMLRRNAPATATSAGDRGAPVAGARGCGMAAGGCRNQTVTVFDRQRPS